MTIRDLTAYANAAVDWAILDGCFAGRIKPTDIDGCVERNGQFLVLEAKPSGKALSRGQEITLTRLAACSPSLVLVFWGHPPDEPVTQMRECWRGIWRDHPNPCLEVLRERSAAWFKWADTQRPGGVT
jgi:hypothetical protein